MPSTVVAYMHKDELSHAFGKSLFQMTTENPGGHVADVIDARCNTGDLPDGRNRAMKHFLENTAHEWLLFVDTDMGFRPSALDGLHALAHPTERPIVGGLCFAQRDLVHDARNGYRWHPHPTIYDFVEFPDGRKRFKERLHYPVNGVVQCEATGAAFLLIHRSVGEAIGERFDGKWFDRIMDPDGLMSEDISFFKRWMDIHGTGGVLVNTGVRITHHKGTWIGEQDFWNDVEIPPAVDPVDVIVPVLHRPQNVKPFMDTLRASTGLAEAWFVCDPNDGEEIDTVRENGGRVIKHPGSFAEKVNAAYPHTKAPWVFLVGDDVLFQPAWLDHAQFVAKAFDGKVIGTNDLGNPRVMNGDHATHLLIARDYIDEQGASWDGPGVVCHEGYRHWYCNPPEAPIWMADLTFKPLGEVRVGDEVIGWGPGPNLRASRAKNPDKPSAVRDALQVSTVLSIAEREAPIVRVEMESGRVVRCTADHRWLNGQRPGRNSPSYWITPKVGRYLSHVVDEPPEVPADLERLAGWLGGIYDGEGSWIQISQCPEVNPEVHAAIEAALNKLDIPHTAGGPTNGGHFFTLTGGRQGYLEFLHKCQPVKRSSIANKIIGGKRFAQKDRIVSVEPDGYGTVLSMTTTTGNYVAWGYASRNCDDEIVTAARQRGVWQMALGSYVEHMHPLWGKGEADDVYELGAGFAEEDRATFGARFAEHVEAIPGVDGVVGQVTTGHGSAARDVENGYYPPEVLGFHAHPGTLNLLTPPGSLLALGDPDEIIDGPECKLWLWRAKVNDLDVWVMHPDREPPIHDAMVAELLAPVSLRKLWNLSDGDVLEVVR